MPAAIPNRTAFACPTAAINTQRQSTPPRNRGSPRTGNAAKNNVSARRTGMAALPAITSSTVNGVRNNSPRVPSGFSRLTQSAVISGTRIQKAYIKVSLSPSKSTGPPPGRAELCAQHDAGEHQNERPRRQHAQPIVSRPPRLRPQLANNDRRSEEHTSELQSL